MIDKIKHGQKARLFPITTKSHENTATSIFLASLMAIVPFRKQVFLDIGKRLGKHSVIDCYTQVKFSEEKNASIPDGYISIKANSVDNNPWQALVETKIGKNKLEVAQIETYMDIAIEQKIENIITISNEFTVAPEHSPMDLSSIKKIKHNKVNIIHLSWQGLQTQAQILLHKNATYNDDSKIDEDQVYLLEEFVRYISDNKDAFCGFNQMHSNWGNDLNTVGSSTKNDYTDLCKAWIQEQTDLSLILSRESNTQVSITQTKDLFQYTKTSFKNKKILDCSLNVDGLADNIQIAIDCGETKIHYSMSIDANIERTLLKACVNDAFGHFKNMSSSAMDSVVVEAIYKNKSTRPSETLSTILDNPKTLMFNEDKTIVPQKFVLRYTVDVPKKIFKSKTNIIKKLEKSMLLFYREYAVHLKNWQRDLKK